MKAFLVQQYAKRAPLHLAELPTPTPGDGEILVEVHAAALNQLDSKIRDGEFKPILPYRPPFIAGHDAAGTVIALGRGVSRFKVGDAIYARPRDGRIGTLAEYIAIHQDDAALKPANLSFVEAASIPLVGLTAWQALVERARLASGQKAFIQAGSGGVGTIAVQLAKYLGATVATTTSAANTALVRGLGADLVIDYRTQDFETLLSGYDVVLNSQDEAGLRKSLRVLRPGGIAVSISGPPDPDFATKQKLNPVVSLVLGAISSAVRRQARRLGVRYEFLWMGASGSQLDKLTKIIESGAIRPVVDSVFAFNDTNAAFARLESGRAAGKVVVQIR